MAKVLQAFALQGAPTTTPAQIKEATTWLEQFQATTEAWQVADQVLAQPADGTTAVTQALHTFAAQTMRTKIQYDWAELPAEAHASLRSSLLAHMVRFGQGPQPVMTQLALAVGVLALHMEEWHATVVNDLIASLTTPPEEATAKLPCLLELLTVLPEEADNYKVGVLPRQRDNFRAMLSASSTAVFNLLGQVCSQCQAQAGTPIGTAILEKMLRCVSSWIRRHAPPEQQLATMPLIPFGFAALGDAALFDAASDFVVECIHHTTQCEQSDLQVPTLSPTSAPRALCPSASYRLRSGVQVSTLTRVLELVPRYDAALASEDEESARAFVRIFAEAGEQHLRVLLLQPEQWALPVARAVLRGAQHPEAEVAEITFNFWCVAGRRLDRLRRPPCFACIPHMRQRRPPPTRPRTRAKGFVAAPCMHAHAAPPRAGCAGTPSRRNSPARGACCRKARATPSVRSSRPYSSRWSTPSANSSSYRTTPPRGRPTRRRTSSASATPSATRSSTRARWRARST